MSRTLDDLRAILFDTLEKVKSGDMDLDRARTVNEVGHTLINTAKVEIEYLRTVGGGESKFIHKPDELPGSDGPPNGITSIVQHRIKG